MLLHRKRSISMTISPHKKLRVAIIGGGVVGLTLAIALAKLAPHLEVDIYEAAQGYSFVGAGIGMWPRTWDVLQKLGLSEALHSRVDYSCADGFHYRKSDQSFGVLVGNTAVPLLAIHRADLLEALLRSSPSTFYTHFSKRLVRYIDVEGQPINLVFQDGSSATCDIILGADGIKSFVRRTMFHTLALAAEERGDYQRAGELHCHKHPAWTGQIAYRCLVSSEELQEKCPGHTSLLRPCIYLGKHKHIVTYQVSKGQMINVVALISDPSMRGTTHEGHWSCGATTGELVDQFNGWETPVVDLLQTLNEPSRWVISSVESLPTYILGRVALLGDAAHAMTPHQGAGAGQGIEDAFALASLLSLPEINAQTLSLALQVYDEVRRPFSQEVIRRSYETGQLYFMESGKMGNVSSEHSAAAHFPPEALNAQAQDLKAAFHWSSGNVPYDPDEVVNTFKDRLRHFSKQE